MFNIIFFLFVVWLTSTTNNKEIKVLYYFFFIISLVLIALGYLLIIKFIYYVDLFAIIFSFADFMFLLFLILLVYILLKILNFIYSNFFYFIIVLKFSKFINSDFYFFMTVTLLRVLKYLIFEFFIFIICFILYFDNLVLIFKYFYFVFRSHIILELNIIDNVLKKRLWELVHKDSKLDSKLKNSILFCLKFGLRCLLNWYLLIIGILHFYIFSLMSIFFLSLFINVNFCYCVFHCSNLWDILSDICLEIFDSLPCGGESVESESSVVSDITSLPQSIPREGTPVLENDLIESSSSCGSSDLDSEASSLFPEYGFEYSKAFLADFPYGIHGSSSSDNTITSFNSSQGTIEGSDFYQKYLSQDSINTIKSVSVPISEHDYDCLSQHSEGWYPDHSYDYVDFNRNPNYHPYLDVDNPLHPYHDIDSDNVNEL